MRQPNPNDIRETNLNPRLNAPTINIGVAAQTGAAGRAIGAAVADLGNAFGQIAARSAAASDAQNDARYKLELSKADAEIRNDIGQNTPEDGSGWSTYGQRFSEKAKELGEKYPVSGQKRQLNREIYTGHRTLQGGQHALKQGQGMALKYHQGVEAKELQGVYQRITANPSEENANELTEIATELVQSGVGKYYTRAQGEQRTREVVGMITMARYQALLKSDPEAAKTLLDQAAKGRYALELKDAGGQNAGDVSTEYPDFRGRKAPASIRYNNPGAQYPGQSARKFGSTETKIIGGGHKIAVFPTAVHGAAAHFDLLNRAYTGKTLASLVKKWGGNNSPGAYAANVAKRLGISSGTVITKEMLQKRDFAVELGKAMASHEAGKGYPLSDSQWRAGYEMFRGGSPSKSSPAKDGEIIPPEGRAAAQGLSSMIPPETMERLGVLADENPDAKISDVLSDDQKAVLKKAGINPDAYTVADASELMGQNGQKFEGDLQELPAGRLVEGQVFAVNSKQFGVMKFPAEAINAIPRKMLTQFRRQANEQAKIRAKEHQVLADDLMSKQIENVTRTGKSHPEWDQNVIREAYAKSPKKIAQFNKRLEVARNLHAMTGDAANMPDEALETRLNHLENKIMADGGADPEVAKAYGIAKTRIERVMRERQSDPAKAVMGSREVKDAISQIPNGKLTNKADVYRIVDARLKAQTRLGLTPTPISKKEANNLLAPIASAAPKDKRKVAQEIVGHIRKMYGSHAPLVMRTAIRLSSMDTEDDRAMLAYGERMAERNAGGQTAKRTEETNAVEKAMEPKDSRPNLTFDSLYDRVPAGKPADRVPSKRNPYEQFD